MGRVSGFLHKNSYAVWHKVFPIVNLLLVAVCIWGQQHNQCCFLCAGGVGCVSCWLLVARKSLLYLETAGWHVQGPCRH